MILLTIITQIGGIILLLSFVLSRHLLTKIKHKKIQVISKVILFPSFYLICSFFIVPAIAKPFGRVPLPVFSNQQIKPLTIWTCLLNRHYVSVELFNALESTSRQINKVYPHTVVSYLDGNFPFFDGFPLLPHLSHNDGKKLDLAFFYRDSKTDTILNHKAPSFIGYGVYEKPKSQEINQPNICHQKGYWHYSFLSKVIPQWNKSSFIFDKDRTRLLVELLSKETAIRKIFIEPHLKQRMNLTSTKIRFHGCQAVRHDDHIHIQL